MERKTRLSICVVRIPKWPQLVKRCIDVDRIPQHNNVDHQTKSAQLVLLSFPVALTQFTPLTVK